MFTTIACLAFPLLSGCGGYVPQPGSVAGTKTDAPILWAPSNCPETSHQHFPEYDQVVPFTGAPTPMRKVKPAYPDSARRAGVQGTVVLAALVCEHGRVVATRVIDSIPLLDVAAANCVRQWDWSPANLHDLKMAAWIVVPVKFSIH